VIVRTEVGTDLPNVFDLPKESVIKLIAFLSRSLDDSAD
jgi:hypothetical protein